jgi:hypothetical protein
VLFGPDDLSAQLQPASRQIGGDDVAMQSPEPDIGDIPGEQRISLPPVGAIVVEHFALREIAGTAAAARSPGRIVADPIRRIGDHQVRLRSCQHWRDIGRAGAVAAASPVVSQQPHVAALSDRVIGYFRDAVRIRQTDRPQTGQNGFELIRLEADQAEIETGKVELPELVTEQLEVPARPRRQLVVGQAISALLLLAPAARDDHRDGFVPQLCRGSNSRCADDHYALLVDQHRHGPPKFDDGGSNFVDVGLGMKPRIGRVGYQPLDRPAFRLVGRPRTGRSRTCGL